MSEASIPGEDRERGTVLESVGGVYRVALETGAEEEAFLRGRLKQEARTGDRVVAGDHVAVSPAGDDGGRTIEEVLDRRNDLVRGGPGGRKAKVVVANVDRIAVVLASAEPAFREDIVDRFLVLAESCGIPPLLVLNKTDLPGSEEIEGEARTLYEKVGYPVVTTSAATGEGVESLRGLFEHGISAMVGPSGVGKSSLLNALLPGVELRTAPVTRKGGRGRHTTVGARLIRFSSAGWIADTPGFSEVGLWRVDASALGAAFPDFDGPARSCRFRACTHSHEPDCGVKSAVDSAEIDSRRYRSYLILLDELES